MKRRHILGLALGAALLAAPAQAAPKSWSELAEVRDAARLLELEAEQLNQFAWGRAGRARAHQEGTLRNFTRLQQEAREFHQRVDRDGPYAGNAYVRWQQLWDSYLDAQRALRVLDRGDLWYEFRDVEYHMSRLDRFYDARNASYRRDDRRRGDARYVAPRRPVRPVVVQRVIQRPVVVRPARPVVVQRIDDDRHPGKAKGHDKVKAKKDKDDDDRGRGKKRGAGQRKHGD